MSVSVLIFVVLGVLIVASLPMWKHSKMWGGGHTPAVFLGLVLALHTVAVIK